MEVRLHKCSNILNSNYKKNDKRRLLFFNVSVDLSDFVMKCIAICDNYKSHNQKTKQNKTKTAFI